jgi:hypothetical protein
VYLHHGHGKASRKSLKEVIPTSQCKISENASRKLVRFVLRHLRASIDRLRSGLYDYVRQEFEYKGALKALGTVREAAEERRAKMEEKENGLEGIDVAKMLREVEKGFEKAVAQQGRRILKSNRSKKRNCLHGGRHLPNHIF